MLNSHQVSHEKPALFNSLDIIHIHTHFLVLFFRFMSSVSMRHDAKLEMFIVPNELNSYNIYLYI